MIQHPFKFPLHSKLTFTHSHQNNRKYNGIWNKIQFHSYFSSHQIITFAFNLVLLPVSQIDFGTIIRIWYLTYTHLNYDKSSRILQMGGRLRIWVKCRQLSNANGQFIANNFSISQMFYRLKIGVYELKYGNYLDRR